MVIVGVTASVEAMAREEEDISTGSCLDGNSGLENFIGRIRNEGEKNYRDRRDEARK
jgi:hypothetical protein